MKESLTDLNSLMFEELERLGNDDLKGEALQLEMSLVARNIINNGELVLKALKFQDEKLDANSAPPKLLGGSNE